MNAPSTGSGLTTLDKRRVQILAITSDNTTDNPADFTITLPEGSWWKVTSLSAVVNLTGVVGNVAFSANCSLGNQTYWTAVINGPLSYPTLVGSVCLAQGLVSVNIAPAPTATAPLPYVIVPGGSIVTAAAFGGAGNIAVSNIVAIAESYEP